jgi:hypothetical protein
MAGPGAGGRCIALATALRTSHRASKFTRQHSVGLSGGLSGGLSVELSVESSGNVNVQTHSLTSLPACWDTRRAGTDAGYFRFEQLNICARIYTALYPV